MRIQKIPDLFLSRAFVEDLVTNPENFYREKQFSKMKYGREQVDENGHTRMRNTLAPVYYLKHVQQTINGNLNRISLPDCMYGGIVGRNNIHNSLYHLNNKYFFTIDLKDFFSNITNKQVNHALLSHGYCFEDARLITKICTYKRGLPQGAPTSGILANLVFASTALKLEVFCKTRGIKFSAFVDDLAFSSMYDFGKYRDEIIHIVRNDGFLPNYKKIRYRHNECEITGLYISGNEIFLEKEMLKNMHNPRIKAYADQVYKQHLSFLGKVDNYHSAS